jgi:hypothetical protein
MGKGHLYRDSYCDSILLSESLRRVYKKSRDALYTEKTQALNRAYTESSVVECVVDMLFSV